MPKDKRKKRQKGKGAVTLSPGTAIAGQDDTREDVIARMLKTQSESSPVATSGPPSQPMIQDAGAASLPARPPFDMPDFSASASLLARVQSFLPQLQQANTSLPADHAGDSAFDLIEENSDEETEAETSNDIKHINDSDIDEDSDEDDDEPGQPQIVMNLALGVLEEKKNSTESSDSSDSSSSEGEDSSQREDDDLNSMKETSNGTDQLSSGNEDIKLPGTTLKKGPKPLIEEMS